MTSTIMTYMYSFMHNVNTSKCKGSASILIITITAVLVKIVIQET